MNRSGRFPCQCSTRTATDSLDDYRNLLEKLYPEKIEDIQRIVSFMERMMKDTATLYGIDNPHLKDLKKDRKFLFKELLPYLGKFLLTVRRMNRLDEPVEEFLEKMSSYRPLTDIIDQHFFKNTPTSFAMGYFYVYLDYIYPMGGTGQIPRAIEQKIIEWGGKIQNETEISEIIPSMNQVIDTNGNKYPYDYDIFESTLPKLNIVGADFVEHSPIKNHHAPDYAIAKLIYKFLGIALSNKNL